MKKVFVIVLSLMLFPAIGLSLTNKEQRLLNNLFDNFYDYHNSYKAFDNNFQLFGNGVVSMMNEDISPVDMRLGWLLYQSGEGVSGFRNILNEISKEIVKWDNTEANNIQEYASMAVMVNMSLLAKCMLHVQLYIQSAKKKINGLPVITNNQLVVKQIPSFNRLVEDEVNAQQKFMNAWNAYIKDQKK
ncbi:hypothetical protein [Desulfotignum balticum]|jgi:hypothetical protein|uniref:hypothetical protein n=1 Tax=Desulfotignum balticum TaxID=115781 RepID=UPI000462A74E|nr:hypothetical protein [Desulfotignum balticum]